LAKLRKKIEAFEAVRNPVEFADGVS